MKSGLHVDEFSNGGGLPPGSPEARAAIERAGREHNGGASWRPGAHLTAKRPGAAPPGKLTEDDVRKIKRMLRDGSQSIREIAAEFAVSKSTIHDVASGESWADVEIDDEEEAA